MKNIKILVWLVLFFIGLIFYLVMPGEQNIPHAWRMLLVNFIFFTPLAAGLTVWPAVVELSSGNWSGELDKIAFTGITFSVPSILALIFLWFGASYWAPWYNDKEVQNLWLSGTFLFLRDIVSLILFWFTALVYLIKRNSSSSKKFAGVLILVYCLVFSLLGFDLVMPLKHEWSSSLFGGYFFISGLYTAAAAWALLSIFKGGADKNKLHDIGKIITAFALLTGYFVYSQFLPQWYENLPSETVFLTPRLNYESWYYLSLLIVFVVYAGPAVFLLTVKSKTSKVYLSAASVLILLVMWIERFWLVEALFAESVSFGIIDAASIFIFLGLFVFGISLSSNLIKIEIKEVR